MFEDLTKRRKHTGTAESQGFLCDARGLSNRIPVHSDDKCEIAVSQATVRRRRRMGGTHALRKRRRAGESMRLPDNTDVQKEKQIINVACCFRLFIHTR